MEMLTYEKAYWEEHPDGVLCGIDEVGRGPLAGPVVACAVIIPKMARTNNLKNENIGTRHFFSVVGKDAFVGLTDSKKLSAARREEFCRRLEAMPEIQIGMGWVSAEEIDEINILQATYRAMRLAVEALPRMPDHALVDGKPVKGLPCASTAIVKGDSKSLLIAAASVIAKVHRDRFMDELDIRYPGYGFARHKGYGTTEHCTALSRLGPCPEHRRSFTPVKELL